MKVGVIGGGVVGRATAGAFEAYCEEVRIFDTNPDRRTHSGDQVLECDLVFVCIPEREVERQFSYFTEHKDTNFVIKSTVPIGTTRRLADRYGLTSVVHSPEFLTVRTALEDAKNPRLLVVGSPWKEPTPKSGVQCVDPASRMILSLYNEVWPDLDCAYLTSDESEAMKLAMNSFFAVKVAFFNEVYQFCHRAGLNYEEVREALVAEGRVGDLHTHVPGPDGQFGFGGTCLLPGTRVSTPSGWILIQDIKTGDRVLSGTDVTTVTGTGTRIVDEVVTVRARGRSVTGSVDHIHFTDGEQVGDTREKLLGQFRPRDRIIIPKQTLPAEDSVVILGDRVRYAKDWRDRIEWTPELAWMVGLWLADGYRGVYPGGGRTGWVVAWTLGEAKVHQAERLVGILNGLGVPAKSKLTVSDGTYGESRCYVVRVRTAWMYSFMEAIGIGRGAHGKRAPVLSEKTAPHLIGGWLDGDGSRYDGTIAGHSESTDLIADMDRLFLGLGICPHLSKSGKDIKISTKSDVQTVAGWTTRLRTGAGYARSKSYASPTMRKHPLGWSVEVQDVTFSSVETEVVSIETESGTYVANGHLTHNCLPKDLKALIDQIETSGCSAPLMRAAHERNKYDRVRNH